MNPRWMRPAWLLLSVSILLAACDGGGGQEGGGSTAGTGPTGPVEETLDVQASEFAFDPSELSATADTTTAIRVTNAGSVEHDLTIDETGLVIATPTGETAEGTFSLPAGTYTFYCSIPGHREAGMEGTLQVT